MRFQFISTVFGHLSLQTSFRSKQNKVTSSSILISTHRFIFSSPNNLINQQTIKMSTLIYTLPTYSSSSETTRKDETSRNSSVTSTTSLKNSIKYVARKLKEHERQSQMAWEALYGFPTQVGGRPQARPSSSRNASSSSTSSTNSNSISSPGSVKKAWSSVKQAAKAHHEAANAAYSSYYGDNRMYAARGEEARKHSVAY